MHSAFGLSRREVLSRIGGGFGALGLASVFAEQGLNTLVVDAADTAPEPGELAFIDLGACVEPLSPQLR